MAVVHITWTPFHLLWLVVACLTIITAGVTAVRLLHVRPIRVIVGALVPVMILGLSYTVPVAYGDVHNTGLGVFGNQNVKIHWPKVPKGKKVVYLTFDDGPDPESTPYILSVLLAYKVPAAFFDIGKNIEREPGAALVKEEVQDGMVVGDHSWSHPHLPTVSETDQQMQVLRTASLIQQITGVRPKYLRYPYGQKTAFIETHLKQWGFEHSAYWSDAGDDWFPLCPGQQGVINNLLYIFVDHHKVKIRNPNLHNGSVLLLHDSSECGFKQLQFLPKLIVDLRKMGYTFGVFGTAPYPYTPTHPGHE